MINRRFFMTMWQRSMFILLTAVLTADGAQAGLQPDIDAGKAAYGLQCARCHGAEGMGNGPDARRVPVPPRDFTSGVYKFRSTVSGTPPSDEDLLYVINHGLTGSGMPSFANLDLKTKSDIVAYIKSLSTVFSTDIKPQPLAAPDKRARIDLKRGKAAFEKLQCALCHGAGGRANGPSAPTLVDQWGHPLPPANLTQGWTYRAGGDATQIYYRLMAGINGSPMPSYDGAVTTDEAWQLANYVASIQLKTNWSFDLQAARAADKLPEDPKSSAWDKLPRTEVNLQASYYDGGKRVATAVNAVSVQAVYDESSIAFRLSWDDTVNSTQSPADAVMVAIRPQSLPGAADIRANLHTLYGADAPALNLSYWSAADPAAARLVTAPASVALRNGFAGAKALPSSASFEDGRWSVVIVRPLDEVRALADPKTGAFLAGFAAWNGEKREAGERHSTSQWITVHLKPMPNAHH